MWEQVIDNYSLGDKASSFLYPLYTHVKSLH